MADASSRDLLDPSSATTAAYIAELRCEQYDCWRRGERVPAETFINRDSRLQDNDDAILDLILSEVILREEVGEKPRVDEYVTRFPRLEGPIRRQFAVHQALNEDEQPSYRTLGDSSAKTIHGPPVHPSAGPTAAGGYELIREIGRGGMGVVYRARHIYTNRDVALKMILAGTHAGPRELHRFRTEAEAVARLHHPNIVQVYEAGILDGRPFLALELVDGVSLAKKLSGTPMTPRAAPHGLESLARAVHYAHLRGIVHRDLKPGNILVESGASSALGDPKTGEPSSPVTPTMTPVLGNLKITDFGLAKLLDRTTDATGSGSIIGTPSYMAPEQASGKTQQVSAATDIYSLGAILYEMLTGRPPFRGQTQLETLEHVRDREPIPPTQLQPSVPSDIESICLTCLQKNPTERYQTAEALADDVRAFLTGRPFHARPFSRWRSVTKWAGRHRSILSLVSIAAMCIVGLVIGGFGWSPMAIASAIVVFALAAVGWFNSHLRGALRIATQQQLVADRFIERLHLLLELTPRLISAGGLDEILRLLAETTALLAHAELATIYLVDQERGELWSKVTLDEEVGEIRVPLGTGLCGTVALTGEIINTPDAYADPRFNPDIDRRTGRKTRNSLTLPMMNRDGQVSGVFQVLNKQGGSFTSEDVDILLALASSAAAAIQSTIDWQGDD